MQTPHYSVKRTLGLAPAVSPPIQLTLYSGQFGTNLIDSFVKQQKELYRLDIVLRYGKPPNLSVGNCRVPHLRGQILVTDHTQTI